MFKPIGYVQSAIEEKVDHDWGVVTSALIIDEEYKDGLTGIGQFSHIIVVYHLHEAAFIPKKHMVRRPQGREDMPCIGIFAQRAKDRPNPIGITAVKIVSVKDNIVTVQGLDAIHNTPVLDIKPYYPQYDLKEEAVVPKWVDMLMETYF